MTGPRRIDHLVLAVHDLEAAAERYRALGFQVGARNRHPWGTENHVIQFGSSFLELITVADADLSPPHEPGRFSFGRFVQDYLSEREGLAMLVLDSTDAVADAAGYAGAGIGRFEPFRFEREGRAANRSVTHVAFALAFAVDETLPRAGFFACQQHYPESFWNIALQQHPNGATNVGDVMLGVRRPDRHREFLRAFTGVEPAGDRFALAKDGAVVLEQIDGTEGFRSFGVAVPDLAVIARRLEENSIPASEDDGALVVAAADCFGVSLAFRVPTGV